MDALSDVLRAVRLSGGVFLDGHFTAPWAVISQLGPEDCGPLSPAHVLAYHYVAEGSMRVELDGERPLEVMAGEMVMLPRNDPHVLANGTPVPPVPKSQVSGSEANANGLSNAISRIRAAGSCTVADIFSHDLLFGISSVISKGSVVDASSVSRPV